MKDGDKMLFDSVVFKLVRVEYFVGFLCIFMFFFFFSGGMVFIRVFCLFDGFFVMDFGFGVEEVDLIGGKYYYLRIV